MKASTVVRNVAVVGVTTLLVLGVSAAERRGPGAPGAEVDGRPECPHDPRTLPKGDQHDPAKAFESSRRVIDIPEFHDCQRFVKVGSTKRDTFYLDLFAIYAADSLEHHFTESKPHGFKIAATIYSYSVPDDQLPETVYTPLGLEPGYSCLYLARTDTQWLARVRPHLNSACPLTTDSRGHDLKVIPLTLPEGFTPRDIPPVARWDWDATNSEQYIGIRCGEKWCEIGADHLVPSAAALPVPPEFTSQQDRKVFQIKGWYDQQLLAIRDPGSPVGLRPSSTMGTVVPNPQLYRKRKADYRKGVEVAFFYVTSDEYQNKLNLKLSPLGGPKRNSLVVQSNLWADVMELLGKDSVFWNGNFVATTTVKAKAKVIKRNSHAYMTTPGTGPKIKPDIPRTARWRWEKEDETVWTECLQFCCESCRQGAPGCV